METVEYKHSANPLTLMILNNNTGENCQKEDENEMGRSSRESKPSSQRQSRAASERAFFCIIRRNFCQTAFPNRYFDRETWFFF